MTARAPPTLSRRKLPPTTHVDRHPGARFGPLARRALTRLGALAQHVLEDVTDAIFPAACRHCAAPLPAACALGDVPALAPHSALFDGTLRRTIAGRVSLPLRFLCPGCATTIAAARVPTALAGTDLPCVTAFLPGPALFDLVHAFKYEAFVELAPWFAAPLARAAAAHLGSRLVLVPVPLHPDRRRERGFDQSTLLAAEVARYLGCPLAAQALRRQRATRAQAQLHHTARAANVAGAFAQAVPLGPHTARIVLVDDVVTTGATVRAALAALPSTTPAPAVLALTQARGEAPAAPHAASRRRAAEDVSPLARPGGLC